MPNWLGDAVMATPALGNLRQHFVDAEVVLVGSPIVAELFSADPALRAVIADQSKLTRFRSRAVARLGRRLAHEHGPFDLAVGFPNSFSSRLLLWSCGASQRAGGNRGLSRFLLNRPVVVDRRAHQAEIYNQVVNGCLGEDYPTGPTHVFVRAAHDYPRATAGINPGAAYGSAKRWPPERFAAVACELAGQYDLVLFGGPAEAEMVGEIASLLRQSGIHNFQNLAGKTTVTELAERLAGLELLVTNDSGPMHLAGAFDVPTVSVFGATNHIRTCQWRNPLATIVRHELPCAPCMKRTCPLGHHACMNEIEADEVLAAARRLVA